MFETSGTARLTDLLRQFPSPRFALELGCGDCPGLPVTSPISLSSLMIGVDHDSASLGRARRCGLHLVQADAARLPFRCQFDLILIRHPDIDQNRLHWKWAIQAAVSWLAERGVLLITAYSLSEIEAARRWLAEIGRMPIPFDERRLIPAGLDGRDRFVLIYRKPLSLADSRLSATV